MPDLKIQTDRETFLRSLENWDGATPSFAECVAGALLLATAAFQGDKFLLEVAREARVSRLTVARWALGASSPHPLGQKSAIECLVKQLKKLF